MSKKSHDLGISLKPAEYYNPEMFSVNIFSQLI